MIQLLCLVLLLFTSPVWAMEHYTNILFDNKGNSIKDATVYVYNAGTTTPAAIYSDNGITPKANPFTTSHATISPGAFDFYANDGVYDIVFSKTGYSFDPLLTRRIALFDVTTFIGSGGGGGPTSFTDILAGTNITSTLIVGTGSSLSFSGSGSINASLFKGNPVAALVDGGTNQTLWTAAKCVRVNAGGTALESSANDCSITNPPFSSITTGVNTSATMTVGTGGSLTFSGSGSINASLFKGNGTVAVADGGTNLTSAPDDTIILGNGTTWEQKTIPPCSSALTSKLLYNAATNTISCGVDQSSGSVTFDTIGSGTNTTMAGVVSSGASLVPGGTGIIASTVARPQVTTVNAGNSPYTVLNTDYIILCDTTAAARTINLLAATNKLLIGVKNLGTNSCTINRAGADTIDGATSAILKNQYEGVWLATDASAAWSIY